MKPRKYHGLSVIVMSAAILLGPLAGHASPITYHVNRVIAAGSVTGFIETDGSMGALSASNFVDWNLLLNDGTSKLDLTGPRSGNNSAVYVQGADVGAVGALLFFNFSGIDNGVLLFEQVPFSGARYYCDASQPFVCPPGETVAVFAGYKNVGHKGNIVIAAAPEPGTCILVLTGLLFSGRKALVSLRGDRKS